MSIDPVDLRAVGGVANSLQDGCFPCVCSSNYEDSEGHVWDSGKSSLIIWIRGVDCTRLAFSYGANEFLLRSHYDKGDKRVLDGFERRE
jgi:hypothetical protein